MSRQRLVQTSTIDTCDRCKATTEGQIEGDRSTELPRNWGYVKSEQVKVSKYDEKRTKKTNELLCGKCLEDYYQWLRSPSPKASTKAATDSDPEVPFEL